MFMLTMPGGLPWVWTWVASVMFLLGCNGSALAGSTYRIVNFQGVSADPSISLGGAGPGGLAGVNTNPNDGGIAFGIGNYTQAGVMKLGVFRYADGKWYLVVEGGAAVVTNDGGEALLTLFTNTLLTPPTQYFINQIGTVQTLAPPSGVVLTGITNDGRFLQLSGLSGTAFFDSAFVTQTNIPGSWNGYGRDGLLYSTFSSSQTVRFVDGTTATLPCNSIAPAGGGSSLSQPASGRNCSISAASASGIVAGSFYSADGRQGEFPA